MKLNHRCQCNIEIQMQQNIFIHQLNLVITFMEASERFLIWSIRTMHIPDVIVFGQQTVSDLRKFSSFCSAFKIIMHPHLKVVLNQITFPHPLKIIWCKIISAILSWSIRCYCTICAEREPIVTSSSYIGSNCSLERSDHYWTQLTTIETIYSVIVKDRGGMFY